MRCAFFSAVVVLAASAPATAFSAEMITAVGDGEGQVDIVAWPGYIERGDAIQHADVRRTLQFRSAEGRQVQIAERPEPVIDVDDHDVAGSHEVLPLERDEIRRPARVAAAVETHHHGAVASVAESASPDVDVQTVFAQSAAIVVPADRQRVLAGRVAAHWPRRNVAPVCAVTLAAYVMPSVLRTATTG